MTSNVNVADVERWASALGGAALTAYGIKQLKDRSPAGATQDSPLQLLFGEKVFAFPSTAAGSANHNFPF